MEPTGMQTLAAAVNLTPAQLGVLVGVAGVMVAIVAVAICVVMTRTPTPDAWPADPRPSKPMPPPRAAGPSPRRVA